MVDHEALERHTIKKNARKEFFDLLAEESQIFMRDMKGTLRVSILDSLMCRFGIVNEETLTDPTHDIWNIKSVHVFEIATAMLSAYHALSPLRSQVLKALEKRGVSCAEMLHEMHDNSSKTIEMKLVSLFSNTFKLRGWTTLKFEVINCTSKDKLEEALLYLKNHTSKQEESCKEEHKLSTAALMGKVVSAWKQRKIADGSNGVNAWADIENMLKDMVACPDKPAYSWCQCLPKATATELQQMLEVLEHIK